MLFLFIKTLLLLVIVAPAASLRQSSIAETQAVLQPRGVTSPSPGKVVSTSKRAAKAAECSKITQKQCYAVKDLLLRHGSDDISEWRKVWSLVCDDAVLRLQLCELTSGCLYVPTNEHWAAFHSSVDRPDTNFFASMIMNSFFKLVGGKCPSSLHGHSATAVGGHTVIACPASDGFAGADGLCIPTKPISGSDVTFQLTLMALEGNIGLLPVWEAMVLEGHEQAARKSMPRVREPVLYPPDPSVLLTIPLKIGLCGVSVSPARLEAQVDVLNGGFNGTAACGLPGTYPLYDLQHVDTQIRFTSSGTPVSITDSRCSDCYSNTDGIVQDYLPKEDGKMNVLVCDLTNGLLGFAVFPEDLNPHAVNVVNVGSLPNGSIHNYDEGDTLVHEMGHMLGLYHTFQSGCSPGDGIADTDPQESPTYGAPLTLPVSCGSKDPIHNYMDYTDDKGMCTFTEGQKVHMWWSMVNYMQDLIDLLPGTTPLPPTTSTATPFTGTPSLCAKSADGACKDCVHDYDPWCSSNDWDSMCYGYCSGHCGDQCFLDTTTASAPTPTPGGLSTTSAPTPTPGGLSTTSAPTPTPGELFGQLLNTLLAILQWVWHAWGAFGQ